MSDSEDIVERPEQNQGQETNVPVSVLERITNALSSMQEQMNELKNNESSTPSFAPQVNQPFVSKVASTLKTGLDEMYLHNELVLEDVKLIQVELLKPGGGNPVTVKKTADQVATRVTERMKDIRIANLAGWKAVARYRGKAALGDDADDDRKIRKVIEEIEKEKEKESKKAKSNGQKRKFSASVQPFMQGWPDTQATSWPQPNLYGGGFQVPQIRPQFRPTYPLATGYNPPMAPNFAPVQGFGPTASGIICYKCYAPGHISRECTNIPGTSKSAKRDE